MGDRWGKGRKGSSEWKALLLRSLQSELRGELRGGRTQEWVALALFCVCPGGWTSLLPVAAKSLQEQKAQTPDPTSLWAYSQRLHKDGWSKKPHRYCPLKRLQRHSGSWLYRNDKWDLRGLRGIHHTVHHTHTPGAPSCQEETETSWNLGSFCSAAMFTPGHISPRATKCKETVWD